MPMKAPLSRRLGVLLALAATCLLLASCLVRMIQGRRLTGTCDGACNHYLDCKNERHPDALDACVSDCAQVFSDTESLRAFESLSCANAVEYVEGPRQAAAHPGTRPSDRRPARAGGQGE